MQVGKKLLLPTNVTSFDYHLCSMSKSIIFMNITTTCWFLVVKLLIIVTTCDRMETNYGRLRYLKTCFYLDVYYNDILTIAVKHLGSQETNRIMNTWHSNNSILFILSLNCFPVTTTYLKCNQMYIPCTDISMMYVLRLSTG